MAVQQNNLMILDALGFPRVVDVLNDSIKVDVPAEFSKDLTVGGDLTVQGDIVSRGSQNVLIQDAYLDLGFGNTGTVANGGGFTVSMNRSSTFTAEDVISFTAGVSATSAPTFEVSAATSLASGDIVAIAGSGDSENDGLYVVDSVSGAVVTIKGIGGNSPSFNVPFVQNQFKTATGQSGVSAFKVDLAAVAIADGSAMVNNANAAWGKGTLVSGYMAGATESGWYWDAPTNVSLQEAYVVGNEITTSAAEGDVLISGDQKLEVTATGGVSITNGLVVGVAGVADFNGGVTANEIKIDGDTAQRLYIVGSNGEIQDEAKLVFDGSKLAITGNLEAVNGAFSGTLDVTGASTFTGDMTAGNIDSSTLDASGNVTVGGTLGVTGATTLSDTLAVTGAATLSSTLAVTDAATLSSTLDVTGATTLSDTLAVTGAATLSSTLDVTGDLDVGAGNFTVAAASGNVYALGSLEVDGAAQLDSTLAVAGAATLSDTLAVTGATTLSSTLDVTGATGIDGNFDIGGDKFTVDASTGNTAIAGTLSAGETTLSSATVSDLTDNRIVIVGASGALEDDAKFRFDGTDFMIGTAGSETFSVAVASGNTVVAGTLGVAGDATLDQKLTVTGDTDLQAKLDVAGLSAFASTGGDATTPDFEVAGYAQFAGVLDLNGSIDADVSGMDVSSTGQISLASTGTNLDSLKLGSSGGIDIDAADQIAIDSAKGLSLQGALSSDLTLAANDAADQILTIDAKNSGDGMGILALDADDQIKIGDVNQAGLQIDLDAFTSFNLGAGVSVKAGESLAAGDAVYVKYDVDGPRYFKAGNAALSDDARIVMGIAGSSANAGDQFPLQCVMGIQAMTAMQSLATDKIGKPVYLGIAGALTLTAPTASGSTVFRVGYVSQNPAGGAMIHFAPQFIAKRP